MTDSDTRTGQSHGTRPDIEPLRLLAEHGDALFGYAMARVRSAAIAEELVQDTFLAALEKPDSFRADSELRTWLVGILRHKVLDHFRRIARERRITPDETPGLDSFFSRHGHVKNVSAWRRDRMENLERAELRAVLDDCLEKLGGILAQAFILRVMDGMPTEEVCQILEINPTNMSVRLHRARLGLRDCLQRNWFGKED